MCSDNPRATGKETTALKFGEDSTNLADEGYGRHEKELDYGLINVQQIDVFSGGALRSQKVLNPLNLVLGSSKVPLNPHDFKDYPAHTMFQDDDRSAFPHARHPNYLQHSRMHYEVRAT